MLGPLLASGRDADVYRYGDDRVLRRYRRPGPTRMEAAVMSHARARGYPAPLAEALSDTDMLLERIDGPTMLEDLERRPWRFLSHARTLASLHERLHAIEAPRSLEAPLGDSDTLLHLDLHPLNVILSSQGPMVIDWPNARRGPAEADVAMTWIIMATSDPPAAPRGRVLSALSGFFLMAFLRSFNRAAVRRVLSTVGERRLRDRNVSEAERERIRRLARL